MQATPGIILTDYRTGGTFLSLCLDSHPLMYCARGEPLARRSGLYRYFPEMDPEQILQYIFKTPFCKVALGKVIYRQAGPRVWAYLEDQKNIKIIHLVRRNTFRAACSFLFQVLVIQGKAEHPHPLHHFDREPQKPKPLYLCPQKVLDKCREREKAKKEVLQRLAEKEFCVYTIYYEHMCGGIEAKALPVLMNEEVCEFFGMPVYQLCAPSMRRVNAQYPLSDLISNWRQVKDMIKETEFAMYLEDES